MGSYCSCALSDFPGVYPAEEFAAIAAAGFSHVSFGLSFWQAKRVTVPDERDLFFSALLDTGLPVDWVHAPFSRIVEEMADDSLRYAYLAAFLWHLHELAEYHPRAYVVHAPAADFSLIPAEFRECALEFYASLVAGGKETEIPIALENPLEPAHFGWIPYLLEQIPDLMFCYDSGHAEVTGRQNECLNKLTDRLVCTHFHDNNGRDDQHQFPGNGVIDWQTVDVALTQQNYQGVYGLEIKRYDPLTPKEFYTSAYLALRENLAIITK